MCRGYFRCSSPQIQLVKSWKRLPHVSCRRPHNNFPVPLCLHVSVLSNISKLKIYVAASVPMTSTPKSQASSIHSTSSYLSYPVSHVVSGLYRRLTEPSPSKPTTKPTSQPPLPSNMHNGIYTPPHRTASPFQPPPLTPLSLTGVPDGSPESAQILSRALAEEIRLLVPPRLQLAENWSLVYSLENDGVSLATLYKKCAAPSLPRRSSFVLVVRDAAGGVSAT